MSCTRNWLSSLLAPVLLAVLVGPSAAAPAGKRPLDESRNPTERAVIESPADRKDFPHLGRHFEVMGPATPQYNCIAWSLGVTDQWVWPGDKVADFDQLYGKKGYKRQKGLDLRRQSGVEKVVLYGKVRKDGSIQATHAARQLSDGTWSSKLGQQPLIRHLQPDDLDGSAYGKPVAVYTRPRSR
jgi:type VI secretion system secreted protein VgrG